MSLSSTDAGVSRSVLFLPLLRILDDDAALCGGRGASGPRLVLPRVKSVDFMVDKGENEVRSKVLGKGEG